MGYNLIERGKTRKMILGIRRSAWIEMAVLFGFLMLVDLLFMGFGRYNGVNPHPYWIPVVVLACQYGTREGLLAAIFASLLYRIGNMPPPVSGQDAFGFVIEVVMLPLLWLIAAILLGELRTRHIRERDNLEHELSLSQIREKEISSSYFSLKEIKDKLELHTAAQLRSSISGYHAARLMETMDHTNVIAGIEQMMQAVMGAKKFSISVLRNNELTNTLTHGWQENDQFATSFNAGSALYRHILQANPPLTVLNADQEVILTGQGVMAGSMIDSSTGEIFGMIKIESMPFKELHFGTVMTFSALCEWAGMALANTKRYEVVKSNSMVNPDHGTMSYDYFKRYIGYIALLGKRVGFDVTMVMVKLANTDNLTAENRNKAVQMLVETVEDILRKSDLAFDYQKHSEEFSIVLPATALPGAELVLGKLKKSLFEKTRVLQQPIEFTFASQYVYERK